MEFELRYRRNKTYWRIKDVMVIYAITISSFYPSYSYIVNKLRRIHIILKKYIQYSECICIFSWAELKKQNWNRYSFYLLKLTTKIILWVFYILSYITHSVNFRYKYNSYNTLLQSLEAGMYILQKEELFLTRYCTSLNSVLNPYDSQYMWIEFLPKVLNFNH